MEGYTRHRHEPLDYLRVDDPGFNQSWNLFFGTPAPGVNPRTLGSDDPFKATQAYRLSAIIDGFAAKMGSNN